MTTAQNGDKFISLTLRLPLSSRNTPGTHFLFEAESTLGAQCDQKDYVTEKFE
jgi:hypothetical protein